MLLNLERGNLASLKIFRLLSLYYSESTFPGPAASTSSGNVLKIQIPEPHPRPTESERCGQSSASCVITSLPGDFDGSLSLKTSNMAQLVFP